MRSMNIFNECVHTQFSLLIVDEYVNNNKRKSEE